MPHTLHDVLPHHWYALAEVRKLFEEYAAELGVDLCFQGFQEELDSLPAAYVAPTGALFLLRVGNVPAGVVGVKRLDDQTCELKRLYVVPVFRGTGLANWLMDAVLERARELGYKSMKLDTLARLESALAIYEKRGFLPCDPYNTTDINGIRFLELQL